MPPKHKHRRVLSFLSVGEQIRIDNSCDFDIKDAFPPKESNVPDLERVKEVCDASHEVASLLESDTRSVHDAENDARAMIDDWKATDNELSSILCKLDNLQLEQGGLPQADRAISAVANLRQTLTENASKRISHRCWEIDEHVARLDFVRKNSAVSSHAVGNTVTCQICLSNPVQHYLVPCGHVFCKECSDKTQNWCFTCRGQVQRRMPLFI